MTFQVILPPEVEDAIWEQARYIAEQSGFPDRAVGWLEELLGRIQSLRQMPAAYPVDEEVSKRYAFEVRRLTHGNFHVFYRIDSGARRVEVLAFRHAARQPPDPERD